MRRAGNTKATTNRLAKNYLNQAATSKSRAAFHMKAYGNFAKKVTTCVSTSAVTGVTRQSKSKCTTANAFTSARANHARMGWRQGIESIQKTPNAQRPTSNIQRRIQQALS